MPEINCWESDNIIFWIMAATGVVGMMVYAAAIPVVLFKRLHRESQDEGNERFDQDFMESHGWLVLRYKPSRWCKPTSNRPLLVSARSSLTQIVCHYRVRVSALCIQGGRHLRE